MIAWVPPGAPAGGGSAASASACAAPGGGGGGAGRVWRWQRCADSPRGQQTAPPPLAATPLSSPTYGPSRTARGPGDARGPGHRTSPYSQPWRRQPSAAELPVSLSERPCGSLGSSGGGGSAHYGNSRHSQGIRSRQRHSRDDSDCRHDRRDRCGLHGRVGSRERERHGRYRPRSEERYDRDHRASDHRERRSGYSSRGGEYRERGHRDQRSHRSRWSHTARVGSGYQSSEHLPCGLTVGEVCSLLTREIRPEDYDLLLRLDENVARPVASSEKVSGLPRVASEDFMGGDCTVCLSPFSPEEAVVALPCRHRFHSACISKWLTECRKTCPLCGEAISS